MYKVLEYMKYLGIFMLFVVVIAIITSLINLTGIGSNFISKLGIILTAVSFFVVTALASRKSQDKGYLLGIKLGLIFVITLIIVNLIAFKSGFNIDRLIYYTILIASGTLGGSFGKNFNFNKKK